ncbi:hypothetical protein BNJ_00349 [Kaumoebavirus]|uniref:hypothetical protein n=1 Tax=Kaumoebavirus TaxID=1859492 RepID=UPI0009C232A0|nr:hypothetical protein BNJ_00349 [Kaumoebavirus]ARA72169.1 hypothetical protein BNJ_00349 [Kaumoebavirus]
MWKYLLLVAVVTAQNVADFNGRAWPVDYGEYCGFGVTSQTGVEPLDYLDMACLRHDFCVSAVGYTSCFCSEQLYHTVMNLPPINATQASARDSILKYIYYALSPCSNYALMNQTYWMSGSNVSGYNYFPLFSEFRVGDYHSTYQRGNQGFIIWKPELRVEILTNYTDVETYWLKPSQYENATHWLLTTDSHNPNSEFRDQLKKWSSGNIDDGLGNYESEEFRIIVVNYGMKPVQISVDFSYAPHLHPGMVVIFVILGVLIVSLVSVVISLNVRRIRYIGV